MATSPPSTFAEALRRSRAAAGLTQEELAERARLSARAISDLERGIKHRPHAYTVQRLVMGLELAGEERAAFEAAARRLERTAPEAVPRFTVQPTPSISLPIQPTPFIGRQQEVAEVRMLLGRDGVRLLTLTGPGGVGKTRLALRVAEEMVDAFPDGAVFVPLASLVDPGLVPATIAATLQVNEVGGQPILKRVIEYLQARRLLLILDNFEHLLPAAHFISRILTPCPTVKILVTSRAVLHLSAEHEFPVPPLALPDSKQPPALDSLPQCDSLQLFVERARRVRPDFQITGDNLAALVEICCRLDGLPLAIELAAARIRLFPPQTLLGRLSSRLRLLTGGATAAPVRQQTLRNTLDWSYSLLSGDEQTLFARLSIFAGGCTFEAAEIICNPNGDLDLLEGMASLVDKSIIRREGEEEPRFAMLDTLREYAREKLQQRGEGETFQAAHAAYFLRLAETAERELVGPGQGAWLARLERELDNLRAALRWLLEGEGREKELRLAAALEWFWRSRGYWNEGQRWLEEGLAGAEDATPGVRARALLSLGAIATFQGDEQRAVSLLEEALALCRELGDRGGSARALHALGLAAVQQGQYEQAASLLKESLRLSQELGDRWQSAVALHNLGFVALDRGDLPTAREYIEEALTLHRTVGYAEGVAIALTNLGDVAAYEGDLAGAEALIEEALAHFQGLGTKHRIAGALASLGVVARKQGRRARAWERLRESLLLARELGNRKFTLGLLGELATLAVAEEEPERAARLKSAETALRESLGLPVTPVDQSEGEETLAQIRVMLGEQDFTRAWKAGRAMSLEQAVSYALDEVATP